LEKIFCCISHKIDYDAFIENGKTKRKVENEENEKKREEQEKEEKERLLEIEKNEMEIQAKNEESYLIQRNKALEQEINKLHSRIRYLNKRVNYKDNEMRENVYARAVRSTVSPKPVRQRNVYQHNVRQPNVHFETSSDDYDSDGTQIYYVAENDPLEDNKEVPESKEIRPESKEAYELQINRLKEELEKLTREMGEATSQNLSEIGILNKEIVSMSAERVRFQREKDLMKAEMEALHQRHADAYDRCAAAPVAIDNDENKALKRIIDDCGLELERKEAELAALRCELAKQMEERAESDRLQRREFTAIVDDFSVVENKNKAMRAKLIDLEEMLCKKNIIIKELTKKLEDFEKIEKKGIIEEKEENEILAEKEEKQEKENLSIMINEIDTDSESNPSSPGTIV
jgi:hypothetical protein